MKHSKKNPLIIAILGKAGSGKGTQAKLLCNKFDLEYFGSGDALRKRRKTKDFTGKKLWEVMDRGALVPSFVITKIWLDEFEKFKKKKKFKGLLSDGSPRKLLEAKYFNDALEWYDWNKQVKVFLIDISRKEAFKRLTKRRQCKNCKRLIPWLGEFKKLKNCDKCGGQLIVRSDDKEAAIKKRLQEYKDEVVPVLNYFKKQKRLIKINGEQSIENVFRDVLKALKLK